MPRPCARVPDQVRAALDVLEREPRKPRAGRLVHARLVDVRDARVEWNASSMATYNMGYIYFYQILR
jgi:hypothetical protein